MNYKNPVPLVIIKGDMVMINKDRLVGGSVLSNYFPFVNLTDILPHMRTAWVCKELGIAAKDIASAGLEQQLGHNVKFMEFADDEEKVTDRFEFVSVAKLIKEFPLPLMRLGVALGLLTYLEIHTQIAGLPTRSKEKKLTYTTVPVVIWKRSMILLAINPVETGGVTFSIPAVNVVDGTPIVLTVADEIREMYGMEFENQDLVNDSVLAVDYKRIDSPCPGDPSFLYKFVSARIAYQLLLKDHPDGTAQTPVMKYLEQFL